MDLNKNKQSFYDQNIDKNKFHIRADAHPEISLKKDIPICQSSIDKHNINFGPNNNIKMEKKIYLHDSETNTKINDILFKLTKNKI